MQKRYVLGLATAAAVALVSAQQGPACPYEEGEGGASAIRADVVGAADSAPAASSLLSLRRSDLFAP